MLREAIYAPCSSSNHPEEIEQESTVMDMANKRNGMTSASNGIGETHARTPGARVPREAIATPRKTGVTVAAIIADVGTEASGIRTLVRPAQDHFSS